uniref:Translation initiation factor eIF2B subunit gamma n=1 Tax=Globodera pallida TaxID=36090 RepID=A0A183BNJ3_GLOPA
MASLSECQAVVFAAGRGNRMPSLTNHISKALLPVANVPLCWFPLNLLRLNRVRDCLLVVPREQHVHIESALKAGGERWPSLPKMVIEVVSFDHEEEGQDVDDWGTADVLKRLLGKLKRDNILLISGDLVSDVRLHDMFKQYTETNAVLSCLLTDAALGGPVPGPKERVKKYRDFSMLGPDGQLLFLVDEEDYVEEDGVPFSLFNRCPKVKATAKYKDVHLYLVQRRALDLLLSKKSKISSSFSSIKADLVPRIVQRAKCVAWVPAAADFSMIAQCNNVGAYFGANTTILKLLPAPLCPQLRPPEVGSKCQLKKSVIGNDCVLGDCAKVDNSVLMDGVVIGKGATVKDSILFGNARVGERANVTLCIIGPGQEAQTKEKYANTAIVEEKTMVLDYDD